MKTVPHSMRDERGMALALALFALVVIGALVAGAFFLGTQEQRMGENTRLSERAFARAEGAANDEFRQWKAEEHNARRTYPNDPLPVNRGRATGTVYKLNRHLYAIDMTAMDTISARGRGARRRLLVLGRIRPLALEMKASLTTKGGVKLQGNAAVDGNDHTPNASWSSCAPPDTNKAGIRTPNPGTVTTGGNAVVDGEPPVLGDPSVKDSTFNVFGDVTYADLAARATIRFVGDQNLTTQPVAVGSACDKTVRTNWGDGLNRAAPCGSYFPIIHVAGNLTLNTVQGQGILLVDGDLSVQGSYEWFGVVIVKGSLKTAGGGSTDAHFWGMVMAENVDLELQNISGNATLNYSKCAIVEALEWTGLAALMRSRGFVQLN
ncbi:MAG TPA: hypothetical protein VNI61_11785 [Gemmatimonadales bacterium]|nr:hypothetical protein [Gemmatimonadales bacterium]